LLRIGCPGRVFGRSGGGVLLGLLLGLLLLPILGLPSSTTNRSWLASGLGLSLLLHLLGAEGELLGESGAQQDLCLLLCIQLCPVVLLLQQFIDLSTYWQSTPKAKKVRETRSRRKHAKGMLHSAGGTLAASS